MIIVNKGADYSALGLGRAFLPESEISNDVKTIMSNYSADDIVKQSALQIFFNSIGSTLKAKIRNMVLPIFASNLDEAIYDIITGNPYKNVENQTHIAFNSSKNHLYTGEDVSAWPNIYYQTNDTTNAYTGNLLLATMSPEYTCTFMGCDVSLNEGGDPAFNYNDNSKKIVGAGLVSVSGALNLIRLGDNGAKLTPKSDAPSWWNTRTPLFGKTYHSDGNKGVRIMLVSQALLTPEEAVTLRNAVKALDDVLY